MKPDVCPNCKQPMKFWTESGWHDAEFITEYWRACPNYYAAQVGRDWQAMRQHWAKWRRTPWPDALTVTYHAKLVPHWVQRLLGWYTESA